MDERFETACIIQSFLLSRLLTSILAIQAAILLAQEQKKRESKGATQSIDEPSELRVEKDHIDLVLIQRQDFMKYRTKLYRMNEEQRASVLVNRIEDSE